MNERARAIALLRQARDILVERLTERVLDSSERLLEDALGLGYSSEIEQVYDQVGARLAQISTMLMQLPSLDDTHLVFEPSGSFEVAAAASDSGILMQADTGGSVLAPHREGLESVRCEAWETLIRQLESADASICQPELSDWLGLDAAHALAVFSAVTEKLRRGSGIVEPLRRLPTEIQLGAWNNALALLWECFELQGFDAIGALLHLRGCLAVRA